MSNSLNEMLEAAAVAEGKGVPVDWKTLAITIFHAADKQIRNLEEQLSTSLGEDPGAPPS
jgi:hypothetical protein